MRHLVLLVDDMTAFMNGRNKELVEMPEKGFEEVEERSRSDGSSGKEGLRFALTFPGCESSGC